MKPLLCIVSLLCFVCLIISSCGLQGKKIEPQRQEVKSPAKKTGPLNTQLGDESQAVRNKDIDEPKQIEAPDGATVNRVLSLDGDGDYLQIPDSQSFHSFSFTNAITLEAWVKASSFYTSHGGVNTIIRKGVSAYTENFFLRFWRLSGKPQVSMSVAGLYPIAAYDFIIDKWYHLAGTYDGTTYKIFVNGVNIETVEWFPSQLDLLLLRIDTKFQSDLDHNSISADLRQALRLPLSPNVTVLVREKDSKWLIIDRSFQHTYTVLKQAGELNIYLNFWRVGQTHTDVSDVFIGRGSPEWSFGEYFHGEIDEMRVWNVVRTQEQIQANMDKVLTGNEAGLVGYWNFDGGTANDRSPNGNHGVLKGDAKIVEEKIHTEPLQF